MRNFLADVEAFLARHPEVSPTRFGEESVNDPALVRQLRNTEKPRRPRTDTCEKVYNWMTSYEEKHGTDTRATAEAA
ncbi:hypothetical protein [Azospirillum sp.]|uniref:hypothetical protein n=1 Tax=Azospirillum sp. TaxID=34012 RepID=UPI003D71C11C